MAFIKSKFSIKKIKETIDALPFALFCVNTQGDIIIANNSFLGFVNRPSATRMQNLEKYVADKELFRKIINKFQGDEYSFITSIPLISQSLANKDIKFSISRCYLESGSQIYIFREIKSSGISLNEHKRYVRYLNSIEDIVAVYSGPDFRLIKEAFTNLPLIIQSNVHIQNLINSLAEKISIILEGIGALIWIKTNSKLLKVCGQYGLRNKYIGTGKLDLKVGQGIVGRNFNNKEPYVSNYVRNDKKLFLKNFPIEEGFNSIISIPMFSENESIGSINVFREREANMFSENTKAICKSYSTFSTTILNNALLIAELDRIKNEYQRIITQSLNSNQRNFIKPLGAIVNHEIKNVLNITKSQIEELTYDDVLMRKISGTKQKQLQQLNKKLEQSIVIVKELGEFFLYDSLENVTDFNILDIIKKAVTFLSPKIESSNIEIDIKNVNPSLYLRGNYVEFLMIIFNLLTNSIKAIIRNKKNLDPKGRISFSAKEHAGRIDISVRDNGDGIPNEIKKNIFKPLFTTDRENISAKSSGIGLYGSSQILEQEYKGRLTFISSVGSGATFEISIPIKGD